MKNYTAITMLIPLIFFLLIGRLEIQAQTNGRPASVTYVERTELNQKYEDTKKLIEILGLEKTIKATFPKIIATLKPQFPQVPEKVWGKFQDETYLKKYRDFYTETYEKHFTHEDIKEMLQFYSTPLGQKIISTTPQLMQETMDAANKWGVELQKQLENETSKERPLLRSESEVKNTTITAPAKLTDSQKQLAVKLAGLDSDEWDAADDGSHWIRKPITLPALPPLTESSADQSNAIPLPRDVHYMVQFNSATYFCKEEPKPFGNGFKFKIYPSNLETILSGNVQVMKIR